MDDEAIRELNRTWRGIDEATDVLSFPMQEGEGASLTPDLLGDVVISLQTAERLVASAEHQRRLGEEGLLKDPWTLQEEVLFLAIHGLLHLLGHDHAEAGESAEMEAEERRIFRSTVA